MTKNSIQKNDVRSILAYRCVRVRACVCVCVCVRGHFRLIGSLLHFWWMIRNQTPPHRGILRFAVTRNGKDVEARFCILEWSFSLHVLSYFNFSLFQCSNFASRIESQSHSILKAQARFALYSALPCSETSWPTSREECSGTNTSLIVRVRFERTSWGEWAIESSFCEGEGPSVQCCVWGGN